jgi:hypothetical protein
MKKVKVTYKVISDDGWRAGNRPVVTTVVAMDGSVLTAKQRETAIQKGLYPEGGIDWIAWNTDEEDCTIVSVEEDDEEEEEEEI